MSLQQIVRRYFIYLFFISTPVLFFSCYPGGIEYYNETDIVATQYDDNFDFAGKQNYFMPDTIHHVVEEGKEDEVDRSYDDAVLARIATHMATAGYTRFESDEIADSVLVDSANVVLTVVVTSTEYSGIGYIPGGGWLIAVSRFSAETITLFAPERMQCRQSAIWQPEKYSGVIHCLPG